MDILGLVRLALERGWRLGLLLVVFLQCAPGRSPKGPGGSSTLWVQDGLQTSMSTPMVARLRM